MASNCSNRVPWRFLSTTAGRCVGVRRSTHPTTFRRPRKRRWSRSSGRATLAPLGVACAAPDSPNRGAGARSAVARAIRARTPRSEPRPSGTAAAVAEAWVGAGRGVQDLVYFAVGEHTIGGIVRAGAAVTGAHGRAASVAWMSLNPVEREDYRKIGCLEAEVAAAGIVRRLIWRIKSGDRSRVQDVVENDLTRITLDHVLDGARNGDGVSISVVRDTAKYLGMAAANLVVIADPELLVLGGIMASAADLLLDHPAYRDRAPAASPDDGRADDCAGHARRRRAGDRSRASRRRGPPMIVLSGAALVLPDRILSPGTLVIENGRIAEIRPDAPSARSRFPVRVSRSLHRPRLHRRARPRRRRHRFARCASRRRMPSTSIAARLPRYGVTAFCPTTVACAPDALRRVLDQVRRARETPPATLRAGAARSSGEQFHQSGIPRARSPQAACAARGRARWGGG